MSTTLRIESLHIRLRDQATGETQEIVYDPPAAEPKAAKPERADPKAAKPERSQVPPSKTASEAPQAAAEQDASFKASKPLRAREGKRGERPEGESSPTPRKVPDANITLRLDNETSPPATKVIAVGHGATTWIQRKALLGKPWGRDDKGAPTVVLDDAPGLVEAIKAAHPGVTVDLAAYSSPAEIGTGPGDLDWKQSEGRKALVASHKGNEFQIEHAGGSNHALFYVWGRGKYIFLACGSVSDLKSIAAKRGPTMPAQPDPALASELCRSACKPESKSKRAPQPADRSTPTRTARPTERKVGPVSDEDAARDVAESLPFDPDFKKLEHYIPETEVMQPWGFKIVLYRVDPPSPGESVTWDGKEKRTVTAEVFDRESFDVTWDDESVPERERSMILNVIGRAIDSAYAPDSHEPAAPPAAPPPQPEPAAPAKSRGPSKPRTKSKVESEPAGQLESASPATGVPDPGEGATELTPELRAEMMKSMKDAIAQAIAGAP